MRTSMLVCAIAASAAMANVFAQAPAEVQQSRLEDSHKIFLFGDDSEGADSAAYASLISRFYMDQFRHAQDPRAPYFMLMSRNGKMAMGIGGKINALAFYDIDGAMDGTGFAPYEIAIPRTAPNEFQTSIARSSLFFTAFGTDNRFGDYQLYIEAKFTGSSRTFKLSKAYATVNDWTLGYTKSSFVDPASQPSTVETDGPNSEVDDTRFLLRYMHTFSKKFTLGVSAETPGMQFDPVPGVSAASTDYMPNFAAFFQYGTKNQHVRLAGIVKNMRYVSLPTQENRYVTGWGVNLTTVFSPFDPLKVYAAANTGQGIGSMVNDLSCGDNDLIALTGEKSKMYAPRSYGWYAALQYSYSPSVFSTVIFSQERMLAKKGSDYGPLDYKYGLYGTANVFWNVTPRCQMGAEFNVGKRCDMNGVHRMAYRVGVLAEFSF